MKKAIYLAVLAAATLALLSCHADNEDKVVEANRITLVIDGEAHEFAESSDLGIETLIHWPGCQFCASLIQYSDSIEIDNPEGNPE